MSIPNQIEPFDNDINMNVSGNSDIIDENLDEENSNDNIIFEHNNNSLESNKQSKDRVFCGIHSSGQLSCILNVAVSAIGGGCFNFPYIMYEGGILVSFLIFFFVSLSVYYSIDLLRSFVVDSKNFSFALMTEKILGPKWLKTYALCSFAIYTSMEVSYLSSIFSYVKGMYKNLDTTLFRILYFSISIIIEIIICLYITKISYMHFLSIISIFCFLIILFSLIVISIVRNCTDDFRKFTVHNLFFPDLSPDNFINKLLKIASYIMIYVYGYSYHSTFPTLIGNLKVVENKTTRKVHIISFSIISIAYLLISVFGFILSEKVPSEIFQDKDDLFSDTWQTLRRPFKYSLIIFLLFLIPIRFIVLRDNYITLIGKKKMTFFRELPIVSLFIFICNILVFCINQYEENNENEETNEQSRIKPLVQAFGGIFGVIISFCLPVVNYVSVNGKTKVKAIIGYIILAIFSIFAILSTGQTFYQIFAGETK